LTGNLAEIATGGIPMKLIVTAFCALALWCAVLPAIVQTEPAEQTLLAALRNPSPEVRGGAALALGALDDPRAIAPLFELLRKDPDPGVRMRAGQAIEAFRDPGAVDAFFAELASDNLESLACAIRALGRLSDPRIADRLAELMEKHPHQYVRRRAAEALGGKRDPRAVDALIEQLGSVIPGERALAAQLLGMIGDPRAVEPLIAAIRVPGENDTVLGRASTALGKIGDPRAIEALAVVLRGATKRYQTEAAVALQEIGTAAIPAVAALLKDPAPEVRRRAVTTLARFPDEQVVEPLLSALQDEDLGARYDAVSGLGRFPRDQRIVEPLIGILRQAKPEVRDPELEKQREERQRQGGFGFGIRSAEPKIDTIELRIRAADILGWTRDRRAAQALLETMNDGDHWVRQAAKGALLVNRQVTGDDLTPLPADKDSLLFAMELMGYAGDERSVSLLLNFLADTDPQLRGKAAQSLGQTRATRAGAALRKLLQDLEAGVRAIAAWSLGELRDQAALDELLSLLQRDGDPRVRAQTALALGKLGDPRAVDSLIPLLLTDRTDQYAMASQALVMIGDPRAIEPLIEGTKHKVDSVRWQAYSALWRFTGDPRIVDAVIAAAKEPVPHLRTTVFRMLATLDDPRVSDLLLAALNDPEQDVRSAAASGLGRLGDRRAVEPLIASIEQNKYSEEFFQTLGMLKDQRAVLPLVRALQNPNIRVSVKALGALGEIGGDIALNELLEYARSDAYEYRWEALRALGNFPDPRAEAVLRRMITDHDPTARGWAAVSLCRLGQPQPASVLLEALLGQSGELSAVAAAILVERKEMQAVEPLIGLLEAPEKPIREMAEQSLQALTGQYFDGDADTWRAWLAEQ